MLAHKMPDGTEKPISYAARTLTPAERNLRRKHFHVFLESRSFMTTCSDTPSN